MSVDVDKELAVRAFERGFARGADPLKRAGRHTVDTDTHGHWLAGFDAGRAAMESATVTYRREVLR